MVQRYFHYQALCIMPDDETVNCADAPKTIYEHLRVLVM